MFQLTQFAIISLALNYAALAFSVTPRAFKLTPGALSYLQQAEKDHQNAYRKLIKTTLGSIYGDTKTVELVGHNIDRQLLQDYGLIAAYINQVNHQQYTAIPSRVTAKFLDSISNHTAHDATSRPAFFYNKKLLAEPIKLSGADLLVSPKFRDFTLGVKQFLVLQSIKFLSLRTPFLTTCLTGIKFNNYHFDFKQPQLDHYFSTGIHVADLRTAAVSFEMLHNGLTALEQNTLEPIIPDASIPSLYNRRIKLYELFERLQANHQFYDSNQDTR